MRRRLLNVLTALSLLVCVAVIVLRARSEGRMDEFRFAAGGRLWRVSSYAGRVDFLSVTGWPASERPRWRSAPHHGGADERPELPRMVGFSAAAGDSFGTRVRGDGTASGYSRSRIFYDPGGAPPPVGTWHKGDGQRRAAVTPAAVHVSWRTVKHGTLTWPLLVAPAAWVVMTGVRQARRSGRHTAGLCRSCGYDLRATPDRCPECGTKATD